MIRHANTMASESSVEIYALAVGFRLFKFLQYLFELLVFEVVGVHGTSEFVMMTELFVFLCPGVF